MLLLDTSSTSGPFLDDFETFVTSFVGLFDDNVGAADGPRIAIASYADAVRDMFLGGDTLSYGGKDAILAAVGPWLQVEKDDYANPETESTTRNLKQAYESTQTLFTSTPRAGGIASLGKRVLMLAATSPSDAGGAALNDARKALVDDGTSIFTIYFMDAEPCSGWMSTPCRANAGDLLDLSTCGGTLGLFSPTVTPPCAEFQIVDDVAAATAALGQVVKDACLALEYACLKTADSVCDGAIDVKVKGTGLIDSTKCRVVQQTGTTAVTRELDVLAVDVDPERDSENLRCTGEVPLPSNYFSNPSATPAGWEEGALLTVQVSSDLSLIHI